MNVSLYQAAAAMNANARWQETITSNLAASSVPGFKRGEVTFSAIESGLMPVAGPDGHRPFSMPVISNGVNWSDGEYRQTGVNTDVAIEGPGFFEIQMGDGTMAYTRDGEFNFNSQGQLVSKDGGLVMGAAGPFQIDMNNPAPLTISATGDVSQGVDRKGVLKVVRFADPSMLNQAGGYYIPSSANQAPEAVDKITLRPGALEGSNTTPMTEMTNLITSMRMFETNNKLLQMQDERMGKTINDLSTAG